MIAIECDEDSVKNAANLPKHLRGVKDVVLETQCVAMVTNRKFKHALYYTTGVHFNYFLYK